MTPYSLLDIYDVLKERAVSAVSAGRDWCSGKTFYMCKGRHQFLISSRVTAVMNERFL
jgi:hypothetical protein